MLLDSYKNKANRRIQLWEDKKIDEEQEQLLKLLKEKKVSAACKKLDMILEILAQHAEKEYLIKIK